MPRVNDSYFKKPPKSDRTFPFPGNTSTPDNKFRNGHFQHIIWLGVGGFIIINHFEPREILLIDPWPTYKKHRSDHNTASVKRLEGLVNWLRHMASRGYALVGVLVSHEHLDHADDVEYLLRFLSKPAGVYTTPLFHGSSIIKHAPVIGEALPTIYCDTGTRQVINDHAGDDHRHLSFEPIYDADGNDLYYDDANYNNPGLTAGKPATAFTAGHFSVEPYLWDHANVSNLNLDRITGIRSGHLQRLTAFVIYSTLVPDAKKSFVVNSAGEMSSHFTGDNVINTNLTVDTLIQSIPIPSPLNQYIRKQQMADLLSYQIANITVRDYIIASHWEAFYPYPAKKARQFGKQCLKRVGAYKSALDQAQHGEGKKVQSLGRLFFEFDYIPPARLLHW